MNKTLKIIIYILVLGLCLLGGWYLGGSFADKEDSVINNNSNNNNVDNSNNVENVNGQKNDGKKEIAYQGWIGYILNSDIKSITYYQPLLDEDDSNFKSGVPGFYAVDLSKDELIDIFNSMNNSTMGLVVGLGGVVDYLEIDYVKDGNNYSVTISEIGSIFSNDDEYNNILANEVKGIYNNMTDEEKKIYGENPIGNMIKNWDTSILKKYFNKDKAKVVYK